MRRADVLAYLDRDRTMVAASRLEHWARLRGAGGASAALALAEELRQAALTLQPGWPTGADRAADRASHERVGRLLGLVKARRAV